MQRSSISTRNEPGQTSKDVIMKLTISDRLRIIRQISDMTDLLREHELTTVEGVQTEEDIKLMIGAVARVEKNIRDRLKKHVKPSKSSQPPVSGLPPLEDAIWVGG